MCALGQYLEREGLPTTVISLLAEHSKPIQPPRALWVPFELGRPLGPPAEPAFQTRVLNAALGLLVEPTGPVHTDFPDEAPTTGASEQQWACPVAFAPKAMSADTLGERVRQEIGTLDPWYDLGRERRGRTTVGLSALGPKAIVSLLESYVHTGALPQGARPELDLKYALDDLIAFYQESVTAQPGASSRDVLRWLWTETEAAELLRAVKARGEADANPRVKLVATGLLVPRAAASLTQKA